MSYTERLNNLSALLSEGKRFDEARVALPGKPKGWSNRWVWFVEGYYDVRESLETVEKRLKQKVGKVEPKDEKEVLRAMKKAQDAMYVLSVSMRDDW